MKAKRTGIFTKKSKPRLKLINKLCKHIDRYSIERKGELDYFLIMGVIDQLKNVYEQERPL